MKVEAGATVVSPSVPPPVPVSILVIIGPINIYCIALHLYVYNFVRISSLGYEPVDVNP